MEACGAVVNSSCQRQLPREALEYEVSVFSCGKVPGFSLVKIQTKGAESRQKKKSRPSRACKGNMEYETVPIENEFFLYSEDGFGEGCGRFTMPQH